MSDLEVDVKVGAPEEILDNSRDSYYCLYDMQKHDASEIFVILDSHTGSEKFDTRRHNKTIVSVLVEHARMFISELEQFNSRKTYEGYEFVPEHNANGLAKLGFSTLCMVCGKIVESDDRYVRLMIEDNQFFHESCAKDLASEISTKLSNLDSCTVKDKI